MRASVLVLILGFTSLVSAGYAFAVPPSYKEVVVLDGFSENDGFSYMSPFHMNDHGQIAGYCLNQYETLQGLVWDPISGPMGVSAPNMAESEVVDVNNNGLAVGSCSWDGDYYNGFVWDMQSNTVSRLSPEGYGVSNVVGINDAGLVACMLIDDDDRYPFLYDIVSNTWRELPAPETASYTRVVALNNQGIALGYCNQEDGPSYAVYWDVATKAVHILPAPENSSSRARAMNNVGLVAIEVSSLESDVRYSVILDINTGASYEIHSPAGDSRYCRVTAINDQGVALGQTLNADGESVAFLWDATQGMRFPFTGLASSLYVTDLNNAGQICGECYSDTANGLWGFLWDPASGMQYIDPLCRFVAEAIDVNDKEQVAGTTKRIFDHGAPFVWSQRNGLEKFDDTLYGSVCAINNNGMVVGQTQYYEPYCWTAESGWSLIPLPSATSGLYCINDHGVIGASAYVDVYPRGLLWSSGMGAAYPAILDGLTNPTIQAINNAGSFAGAYGDTASFFLAKPSGELTQCTPAEEGYLTVCGMNNLDQLTGVLINVVDFRSAAWIWDAESGYRDLGTLGEELSCTSRSINDAGQIVGYATSNRQMTQTAFYWDENAGMVDLNNYLPSGEEIQLLTANGINKYGDVAGKAYDGRNVVPYLMRADVPVTLTVAVDGCGGAVCPAPGSYVVDRDEVVHMVATSKIGWEFAGWRGDAKCKQEYLDVAMNYDKQVTAVFQKVEPEPFGCHASICSGTDASTASADLSCLWAVPAVLAAIRLLRRRPVR